jgi:hypothetical protein
MERTKNIHKVTAGPIILSHDLETNQFLILTVYAQSPYPYFSESLKRGCMILSDAS